MKLLAATIASALLGLFTLAPTSDEGVRWYDGLGQATLEAEKASRPMLVVFR